MPAYLTRMPAGVPGDISRKLTARTEAVLVGGADIAYGAPVQLDAAGRLVPATDAAKAVYGFLVRPYPAQAAAEQDNRLDFGVAKAGSVADVLRSGYMTVRLSAAESATPVKGAALKIVFTATGNFAVGEIALSQGTALAGCSFMGGLDPAKNAEIAFNI